MGLSHADKRRDRRARVLVEVTLIGPDGVPRHGLVRNVSSRGAYVTVTEGGMGLRTGAAVTLRFHVRQRNLRFSRQTAGRIVRADTGGVALAFSEVGLVAAAVVEDLCFYAGLCGPAHVSRKAAGASVSE